MLAWAVQSICLWISRSSVAHPYTDERHVNEIRASLEPNQMCLSVGSIRGSRLCSLVLRTAQSERGKPPSCTMGTDLIINYMVVIHGCALACTILLPVALAIMRRSSVEKACQRDLKALERGTQRVPRELQWRILIHMAHVVDEQDPYPHRGLWRILLLSKETRRRVLPYAYHTLFLHTPTSFNRLRYTLIVLCPALAQYIEHLSIRMCTFAPPLALEQVLVSTTRVSSMFVDSASARAMCETHVGRLQTTAKPRHVLMHLCAPETPPSLVEKLAVFSMWECTQTLDVLGDPILAHSLAAGSWPALHCMRWHSPKALGHETSDVTLAQAKRTWMNRGVTMTWDAM